MIGKAFEKFEKELEFEKKFLEMKKNDLKQHKRFKPLHAKPQNSSQRKREWTVHWQILINVTHTTYDGKC